MEEEDYRAAIEIVKGQMNQFGLSDLADDQNFRVSDPDGEGEYRLPDPRKHLILLLEAFDFHLDWTDSNRVQASLGLLQDSVQGGPENAFIQFPDADGPRRLYLTELPDQIPLRRQTQQLIATLKGEGFEPSPTSREF